MSVKLTQEQAIEGIKKVHGDRYDLSQVVYVKAIDPLKIICKEHGEFNMSYNKVTSQKAGCPKCGKLSSAKSRANSESDVISNILKIHGDSLDLSEFVYKGMKEKSTVICKKHGKIQMNPNSLIYGRCGCTFCGMDRSNQAKYLPFDEAIKKSTDVHNGKYDYSKIKDYTETKRKYTIICPTHGDFEQSFSDHLCGKGCRKCAIQSNADLRRNDASDMTDLLNERLLEQDCSILDFKYQTVNEKVNIICKKHGVFTPVLANFLYKQTGCPKCATKVSKDEQELFDFLSGYVDVVQGSRTILKSGKELDIFIPSKNLAVEFNGLYYHSDKFRTTNYHLNKTKECEDLGIRLIQVFEDEWKDKKDIVKSRILSILGKTTNTVFARNTEVREVPTKEAMQFLKDNHIQGAVGSSVKVGLFNGKELVSLMTFGEVRKSLGSVKKDGVFELIRFCNKLNTNVVGGASKLLKHFEKNYEVENIISYADKRWSNGAMYDKLGFDFKHLSKPNYFYTMGNKRESRFGYRKDVLIKEGFDKDKTESQIMLERGFNRIYDCGSLRFEKLINK
jgi:hypothetical protein